MAGYEHRHCVHGEWMTIREAAERLGISKQAIRHWRERHRHPDGSLGLVEEAWDWYTGRASGAIPDSRGREPVRYPYRGELLSVPEVSDRTGIQTNRLYNMMNWHHCDLEAAVKRIDALDRKREINRATRKIMEIINEK